VEHVKDSSLGPIDITALLTSQLLLRHNKLEYFSPTSSDYPILESKAGGAQGLAPSLTLKHWTDLKKLAGDKHESLFCRNVKGWKGLPGTNAPVYYEKA
jgi:hypothetical protein